jgi:hypothetical protein
MHYRIIYADGKRGCAYTWWGVLFVLRTQQPSLPYPLRAVHVEHARDVE